MYYNHLSNQEFVRIKQYLTSYERLVTPLMNSQGFKLFDTEKAGLGIQYNYKGQNYLGSIGFIFDDTPSGTFSFWVIKACDIDDKRYWKRIEMLKSVPLAEIISKIQRLFEEALDKYNSIEKNDLTEVIDIS